MIDKTESVIIGQYSDYYNISGLSGDFWGFKCYCCGANAEWNGDHHALCGGCHFRHTVMKAAGREEEFWRAADARNTYTYEVKYVNGEDLAI